MRIVYLDCFSGISGDMTLASLIDAGANREYIEHHLKKLPIEPFELHYHKVVKTGVTGLKLDVLLDPNTEIIHHRHYVDIVDMIDQSDLPTQVKTKAKKVFEKIGIAEAKVHNLPLDHVHFHEVGAVDSIIDIVGVCLALENLGIDHVYTSPIPLGSGQIKIDHGIYPIPTPATLEILKGIPIRSSHVPFEMTTPTGAGIVAALGMDFSGYPSMTIQTIGYGAGTKDFEDRPNVLRAVVGETNELYVSEPQFPIAPEHSHHHHDHHHEHDHPLAISE